ncbi:rod shape-determining protein [Candidatus Campbellbacteria bacterium CG11_big_fil_rev_8_21_14_0_20_44_21]|uniref:Cell shape-determining protein MreB n=1 Tax=Candidatus Campbellbacteria bacterium CG22_combo_CG10-13_8_21_14_all_43_18 TaxID=1974530 RepID=A0A2H0DXE0_9BACT|nr:MAG: rod shape-determining protein [Candidatus Campbellbacteria bacterium CG22_combo_CG10-13_8_21_14_all_43_18]PIR24133.1 MAG: rod shape-determining protein [Candidatus Campbellbacteria bacterium CG11_big_fil_rev_8_21_14_0_20_44_21]
MNGIRKFFSDIREKFFKFFSNEIGVDLGTTNTLVYVRGKGIIINEPSVVALNAKTGRVVAIGGEANKMLGRTPAHITAIKPLVEGVISDFEVAEEMLSYFINRAQEGNRKLLGPRIVIGVPSGITNVETRAVRDAAQNAGGREVHIIEEPVSAAIGIRLPIDSPIGNMIIDIGGGTTDIAVISLNGIVTAKNVKVAGERFNEDIVSYIRNEFKILIGEKTAEKVKMEIGAMINGKQEIETVVRGRDLVTGLPREVIFTETDLKEALSQSIDTLIESIKEVLEEAPPEIISDIMRHGVYLVGGGALLGGLSDTLRQALKIPIYTAEDPLTSVARGTGMILENLEIYEDLLVRNEEEIPPKK